MECTKLKRFVITALYLYNYLCHTQTVVQITESTKRNSGQNRHISEAHKSIVAHMKPWIAKGKQNMYVSRKASLENDSGPTA